MKKLFALAGCLLSFACFANTSTPDFSLAPNCPTADTHSPTFCSVFVDAAHCHCRILFPVGKFCDGTSMRQLYELMMTGHGSDVAGACRAQEQRTGVPEKLCIEHWTFFKSHCPF